MKYYSLTAISEAYTPSKATLMSWCRSGKLKGIKQPNDPCDMRKYIWLIPETELVKLEPYKITDPEYYPYLQPDVILSDMKKQLDAIKSGDFNPAVFKNDRGRRMILYTAYLVSDTWYRKRKEAMQRDGWKCQICESKKDLQVHHMSYEHLGEDEEINDLITLCRSCHEEVHAKDPKRKQAQESKSML